MRILGIDIGGTKCAVVLGDETGTVLKKEQFPTADCGRTVELLIAIARQMAPFDAIGVSCGGPLDAQRGVILSPPNLPGWDHVEIVRLLNEAFHVPVYLKNDADACALAEWRFGAGRGAQSLIFLSFGTGLGAGLILNGRLYSGASGLAGEVGHIRLADFGPVGYGKAGSFEGFCSGGGLAQLGQAAAKAHAQTGAPVSFDGGEITAKTVAAAAAAGDAAAVEVFRQCGRMLGRGLSVLIDLLNPERIILGSIFARCEDLLRPEMEKEIEKETLPAARRACRILPAALGESIGDVGALCAALYGEGEERKEPEA
ncbi:MAG: ROK family protein [Clostridia bacterium]|nr:ROK family protein [Clostridia bacterium]